MIQWCLPSIDFCLSAGANTDQCSKLPDYRFLSQGAQNKTKSIPLRNPEWCTRCHALFRHPLVPPGLGSDSWAQPVPDAHCQHHTQEGGGSLILPHGAKCRRGQFFGFCMHWVAETQSGGNNWHRMRSGQMPPLLQQLRQDSFHPHQCAKALLGTGIALSELEVYTTASVLVHIPVLKWFKCKAIR